MKYIPTVDDLERDLLPEISAGELDLDQLSRHLDKSRRNLEALIRRDPAALDLIQAARAEVEAFSSLRLLMLVPDALNALEDILVSVDGDRKTMMARVQAAREILDRNAVTAKVSRSSSIGNPIDEGRAVLPPLEEVLRGVPEGDELAVVDRYMGLISEIDAVRRGEKPVSANGENPGARQVHSGTIRESQPEAIPEPKFSDITN